LPLGEISERGVQVLGIAVAEIRKNIVRGLSFADTVISIDEI